jgi:hypothetical protein
MDTHNVAFSAIFFARGRFTGFKYYCPVLLVKCLRCCSRAVIVLLLSGIYSSALVSATEIHYSIDSGATDIRLLIYKQGALQLFGHNHVIRSLNVHGQVSRNTTDFDRSHFKLTLPVQDFVVDRPEDRQRSGDAFDNTVDDEAAQSTRTNLLSQQLLDVRNYPHILVKGGMQLHDGHAISHVSISIKGRVKQYRVPVVFQVTDSAVMARGRFTVRQTDFAIQPMTLFGGLLAVKDEFDVIFTIRADKD